jgi:hypothetical protein
MARPSKFNDQIKAKMIELYEKGKTDDQVAEIIGVCPRTIANWKGNHPEFLQTLKESKQIADDLVEASLFSRAVGYSHVEEKVFCHEGCIVTHETVRQYPPDTAAAIIWLKNRNPKRWREKMPDEAAVNISISLAEKIAKARSRSKEK